MLSSAPLTLVSAVVAQAMALVASFRARYGITGPLGIYGPYSGQLDNSSDSVELVRPDSPQLPPAPDAGFVPYVLADKVNYQDNAPWPLPADGFGPSLTRLNVAAYGNDPANWTAAAPGPGRAYAPGLAPVITVQPVSQTVVGGTTAMFSVSASGATPLSYQWLTNGTILPGATNSILLLPNLQGYQAGQYQVLVLNSVGAVASSIATLNVLIPISIVTPPVEIRVPPGTNAATFTNATFVVVAASARPITYQWSFNGTNISWGTNASLTITNVQEIHDGLYAVVCRDSISSAASVPVRLVVMVAPFFIQPPINQSVMVGENATFSVVVGGTRPVGYRWRRNNSQINTFATGTNFLTITNVTLALNGTNYNCIASNYVVASGILSSNAFLFVLADSDGDRMPDVWETANGFNPNDPSDANGDADLDGYSNRAEYIAGTNPRDASSFLRITQVTNSPAFQITFLAQTNKTYTIQYRDDLNMAPWLKLLDVPARTNARLETITDPSPGTNRVYRIATPVQ